ncbi:multidrug resistance efflux transporter family protein [Anaerocolumna sp. AGMB13020]|uniref:DMT family transporter n=1 Tax=Anaerocolumna sp. AGMB13020 TaxID=3081750 RepID=UPI0029553FC8|nr:multidrug resistance efflux transporter family protein [Anaerocolumna sp. AGMB13020]WOO36805.1 multidrug resistance efflux transporter family protein [Anaerocolumna sp. AGMB13020]
MKKSFILGIAGSFFFAFTFILNRSMNLSGGNWVWSACLRYFFAFPIMALVIHQKYGFQNIHTEIRKNWKQWILWSTIGFGLFYAPLTYAGDNGESWLIAASWQITIVMGILTAPLFGQKIPYRNLFAAGIILIGVFLLQLQNAGGASKNNPAVILLPILVAATAYPLGNRKMMEQSKDRITTIERVYGMVLCSLPFWCFLSAIGFINVGLPTNAQLLQSFLVALFSGILATLLFFKATDNVKHNQKQLAVVESTQAGEVLFTLLGGILLLGDPLPNFTGFTGILFIIIGMLLNSLLSSQKISANKKSG